MNVQSPGQKRWIKVLPDGFPPEHAYELPEDAVDVIRPTESDS